MCCPKFSKNVLPEIQYHCAVKESRKRGGNPFRINGDLVHYIRQSMTRPQLATKKSKTARRGYSDSHSSYKSAHNCSSVEVHRGERWLWGPKPV